MVHEVDTLIDPARITATLKYDLLILLFLLICCYLCTTTRTMVIMSLISRYLEALASIWMLPLKLYSLRVSISLFEISLVPIGNLHYPPALETRLHSSMLGISWLDIHLHTAIGKFTLPMSLDLAMQLSHVY